MVNPVIKRIMDDEYQENIWELVSGLRRMGMQEVVENSLRAKSGQIIQRPLGSPYKFPVLRSLTFRTAQIRSFPTPKEQEIDMKITIGPRSKHPLQLGIPILISGMGYGVAISYPVKMALAKAATEAGTAVNSGEGPFLQEERELAQHYIFQYSTSKWSKDPEIFKQADAIEIHLAQGASGGMGAIIAHETLSDETKKVMGLEKDEDAILYENHFPHQTLRDLKALVDDLRKVTDGKPIGIKISASTEMEKDIDCAIKLGIDFLTIDGGQASTKGAAPILEDDFGIPTLYAILRAVKFLKKKNAYKKISLIISGGLYVPGDFLKAIALGADAVALGSAILYAMTHTQVLKALPWIPPTELVFYTGKKAKHFDVEAGAKNAANFLKSCVKEMEIGIRALGKKSIHEVDHKDLAFNDKQMADLWGIPFTGCPPNDQ